jgi:hypothetical protein
MTSSLAYRLPQLAILVSLGSVLVVDTANAQEQHVSPLTEQHELLKKDVGTWHTAIKVWPGPDAEPIASDGLETSKLLPGGLWLVTRFEGTMAGVPCVGAGNWGYDPVEKKYVGTWVDSMSPHVMTIEGDYDPETKTMTHLTKGCDPQTGQEAQYNATLRYRDDGTRWLEMYARGADGKSWKMMEVLYTRAEK